MSRIYPVEAYSYASRFNLREVEGWLPPDRGMRSTKTQLVVSLDGDRLAYIFDFGAIVFVNVPDAERESIVELIEQGVIDRQSGGLFSGEVLRRARIAVRLQRDLGLNAAGASLVLELLERIEAHRAWLHDSGEIAVREQLRIAHTLENILRAEFNRRILAAMPAEGLNGMVEAVRSRTLDPYSAAAQLLARLNSL